MRTAVTTSAEASRGQFALTASYVCWKPCDGITVIGDRRSSIIWIIAADPSYYENYRYNKICYHRMQRALKPDSNSRGSSLEKNQTTEVRTSGTPCTPVVRPQGAADLRRLLRITAALCLSGHRLCGRTLWPELGEAIGLCVPPAVVETLRGTRGGGSGG